MASFSGGAGLTGTAPAPRPSLPSGPRFVGAGGFGSLASRASSLMKGVQVKPGASRFRVPNMVPGQLPGTLHVAAGGNAPPATPAAPAPAGNPALDATYYANVQAYGTKVADQIAALNLKGSQADTGLQSTLAQLAYAQPRAELALEQRANQMGALYSSVYGQNLGNLNYQYLGREGAAEANNAATHQTILSQIGGLENSIPGYNNQQAALSTGRAAQQAAANPALGGTLPPTHTPAGAAAGGGMIHGGGRAGLANALASQGVTGGRGGQRNATIRLGQRGRGAGTQQGRFTGNFFGT